MKKDTKQKKKNLKTLCEVQQAIYELESMTSFFMTLYTLYDKNLINQL